MRLRRLACLLLLLYGAALVHQVVPHDHGLHDAKGQACPLCLLLTVAALVIAYVVLARTVAVLAVHAVSAPAAPGLRAVWTPCSRRGPPSCPS